MVQLTGHEGAWNADLRELVPERVHRAGAHSAQRAGEARDVVTQALRADLRHVGGSSSLQAGEQGQRPPVVGESLEPVLLDAFGETLVAAAPPFAGVFLQPRMRADGEQREHAVGTPGRDMQRQPAAHRIAHDVTALHADRVPEQDEIPGARVHGAQRAMTKLGFAVTAQVRHDPRPAQRHVRDELAPAAAALGEAVEERDRRAVAGDKVAQPGVPSVQNHHSILWM